jgi:regulator of sirC expression with transglutaminase-like and TPR domain
LIGNRDPLLVDLQSVLAAEPFDLARAALIIARIEHPHLDSTVYLEVLDGLGREAARRLARVSGPSIRARISVLNTLVLEEERFAGNHGHYDDYRNSLLNVVIERRLGIPITLALVYIEIARRAGLVVQGVGFPGHFLMRVPARGADGEEDDVLLDPFDRGVEMDLADCRRLLVRHVGDEAPFDASLVRSCTRRHMLARMLNNLKRTYVEMRSFPQARRVTDLLLAVDPLILSELRDRGLLAYHLDDFPAALRDLEDYLRLNNWKDEAEAEERDQVLDHIKALRRRVAGSN